MRAMVADLYAAGPAALAEAIPLLAETPADQWLAFPLLDLGKPEKAVVDQCLSIIRRLASGVGLDAMGAAMWLRDWESNHGDRDL